ncbi:hypothetical protein HK096_005376 [Nowakowskiella sp. JEL0078]|nr:hypothetical protein HK096_005376 [Nowakowskiella sp. JEL0078]
MAAFEEKWKTNLQSILRNAFQHPLQENKIIEGLVTSLLVLGIQELHFIATENIHYSYNGKTECFIATCSNNDDSDCTVSIDDSDYTALPSPVPENDNLNFIALPQPEIDDPDCAAMLETSNTTSATPPRTATQNSIKNKRKRITEEDELDNINNSDSEENLFDLEDVLNKFME